MDLLDKTRNQHFLPQTEQRLNAINPLVDRDKQRIYEFEILSNTAGAMRLGTAHSRPISTNLSMLDLFSFDVDRNRPLRQNFERLFHRYEAEVEKNTESLLTKLATGDYGVSDEVENIYAAKLMNFARNPYSVVKILNTFGELANYTPQDPAVRELFNKVLNGRRKHEKYLCKELKITNAQYSRWLRMLFNMLVELKPGFPSLFDETVRNVFTSKQFALAVLVCTYSTPRCLLSDRAMTTNTDSERANGFDFNLNSRAFIRYIVMDRTPHTIPAWMPPGAIDMFMNSNLPITLRREHDHEDLLRSFNMNVVAQSHSRVFCATDKELVF
ncbi:hypothetical protein [Thiomonas intermedia]|uniref:hypothetical protein n=1 Tax=Thiomonas intermedia TaxID=926 RepID=UPI0009A53621|nr:hypothetical protein [Thiomonas intermedia]